MSCHPITSKPALKGSYASFFIFCCSYDYTGYGLSKPGKPSEKNLYADIDAAFKELRQRYGISPENIILYGQSIGTVPTVDLASRFEVGAVILVFNFFFLNYVICRKIF